MKPSDTDTASLPTEGVTRRDFVGGTLVGAGAALLGMGSPAAIREAQAQTLPSKMTGLGPEWTRAIEPSVSLFDKTPVLDGREVVVFVLF